MQIITYELEVMGGAMDAECRISRWSALVELDDAKEWAPKTFVCHVADDEDFHKDFAQFGELAAVVRGSRS